MNQDKLPLEEFNHDIWNSWILEGYKFIRYRHIDKNTVALMPYKGVDPEKDLEDDEHCFFGIMEDDVSAWADNEIPLLENFKFYVEDGNEQHEQK